ncbi:MAG: hypothetical protein GY758_08740 [Fuerstiella sp.]|nr:hypothetical protein [Fuerstiella sp.]
MSNSHAEGRNGDMEANDDHERFTRLLIEHEPELLRCVLVAVPNRDDARDMMQECSVALWRRFSEFDRLHRGHWGSSVSKSAGFFASQRGRHSYG